MKMALIGKIKESLFKKYSLNKKAQETYDSEALGNERLPSEEVNKITEALNNCFYNNHLEERLGQDSRYLEEGINYDCSHSVIRSFRTLALKSYDKEEFKEEIPESLRPFIDRGGSLELGKEKLYHERRIEYVDYIVNQIDKNPKELLNLEKFLFNFFIKNLLNGENNLKKISNATLQFSVLENNMRNIYSLLGLRGFGDRDYIIGVDKENHFLIRKTPKEKRNQERIVHLTVAHSHAVTFLNLDPEIMGQLIPDHITWALSNSRFKGLGKPSAGILGFQMLKSGQENKHFHSSLPHEIILGDKDIKRMTVIDVPPNQIYFKTKFYDNSISVGSMYLKGNYAGGCSSDLISQVLFNETYDPDETNILYDLAGSIARDMFICERRDRFYTIHDNGASKNKRRRKKSKIIWLPRFKINLRQAPFTPKQSKEYIMQLSPSHVSGHRRKCDNPSEGQIELARSLGIRLPLGYTYVKEHDRKESKEFSRLYKSSSAMSLLYGMR